MRVAISTTPITICWHTPSGRSCTMATKDWLRHCRASNDATTPIMYFTMRCRYALKGAGSGCVDGVWGVIDERLSTVEALIQKMNWPLLKRISVLALVTALLPGHTAYSAE